MNTYSKWLIRVSAIYALLGALLGSDMAGRKDLSMIPAHAHILVVGWLTLFAYGIFYQVFHQKISKLKIAKWQTSTSLIGGGLMPLGMLLYYKVDNTFTLIGFIVPASILLIAMLLFVYLVFFDNKLFSRE